LNRYFSPRFDKDIVNISPGEFYATGEPLLISTILGSCISAAVYDSVRKMGGMNHFMLVEGRVVKDDLLSKERYGLYAMESLLNELYRTGSKKKDISAKIFGGARVISSSPHTEISRQMDIGARNAEYAREFLNNENIPIKADDTGGIYPRRLFMDPLTFKILVKKTRNDKQKINQLLEEMESYRKKLDERKDDLGEIILFE
jgi:chemotaxis protein CheD